jgi:hypothetical protein
MDSVEKQLERAKYCIQNGCMAATPDPIKQCAQDVCCAT